ncbi:MAG: conjugal transfer protein TraG N-terminal domain-containing protein [Deltaproteobacteria bacterium]|nr:MAG: conjugal transfer protein TraG N-terminal domain-containing protein [Deltaproteobacteria bacterium]
MNPLLQMTDTPTMTVAKWGMVTICFTLGILRQISSEALDGELRLQWGHLLMRLLFVILLIQSAGAIQGSIWGAAKSIGDGLLPGPTLWDMNVAIQQKIETMKEERALPQEEETSLSDMSPTKWPAKMMNVVFGTMLQGLEQIALSLFFILYKFLQSAQNCVMMFLAGMVPFVFPPSIIPGVNSWASWLKMVISVALWPVVAGFLIKGQMVAAAGWFAGPAGASSGGLEGAMSGDVKNLFLNMDSLGMFAEAVVYGFMILSSPFISSALVYGSANALSTGASLIMAGSVSQLHRGLQSSSMGPASYSHEKIGGSSSGSGDQNQWNQQARPSQGSGSDISHSARYLEGRKTS